MPYLLVYTKFLQTSCKLFSEIFSIVGRSKSELGFQNAPDNRKRIETYLIKSNIKERN